MNFQSQPQRKGQVICQKASNEYLLFNMQDGNYYSLNEVGQRIWELCDGTHTVAQVVDALATEFDAPRDLLANDVVELLEHLQNEKLIVESGQREAFAG